MTVCVMAEEIEVLKLPVPSHFNQRFENKTYLSQFCSVTEDCLAERHLSSEISDFIEHKLGICKNDFSF